MAFTIKKGDLVYTADGTLGFVSDVYRPERGSADEGWAAVDVTGLDGPVYFTAQDVKTRDETVPSVLLSITYNEATSEERRREPRAVATGEAQREDTPPLEVGRPELPGDDEQMGSGSALTEPGQPPHPDAVRDWPNQDTEPSAPGTLP